MRLDVLRAEIEQRIAEYKTDATKYHDTSVRLQGAVVALEEVLEDLRRSDEQSPAPGTGAA